jgi:hypothetical protein
MAIGYIYCEDCSAPEASVNVTQVATAPYVTIDGYSGPTYIHEERIDLWFTIPEAITCDITIRVFVTITVDGSTSSDYLFYTIPAGDTQVISTYHLAVRTESDPQFSSDVSYSYELTTQSTLPSCGDTPPECDVSITSVTITPPSLLGASDGSLTVHFAGTTGSSYTFRLNAGTPQSSPTFNSLSAGIYQVRIDEGACFDQENVTIPNGPFATGAFTVTEPADIVATENPIIMNVSTGLRDATSLKSKINLTINSGIGNNYRIQFNLNSPISYSTTFSARDFPSKSNYFLSNKLTDQQGLFIKNNTTTEIASSLAQSLQNDIIIGRTYYVNNNSNVITLVAKEASSRFDLDTSNITRYSPSGSIVTTGITLTVLQSGTDYYDGDILENYNVYSEVYAPFDNIEYGSTLTTDLFNHINSDIVLPYTKSNIMQFNFSDICKSFVSTPKPDFEFTGFTTLSTYMQPFFFKYGEIYPLITNTNTNKKGAKGSSKYVWVTNAALNYEESNDMTRYTGQTTIVSGDTIITNVPFLTNSPSIKHISKRQRELLYFILPKDYGRRLEINGTIQFWDGTTLPEQTFITIADTPVNFGGCFVANVSYDILGLPAIESFNNKKIKKLDIYVNSNNGTNAELLTNGDFISTLSPWTNIPVFGSINFRYNALSGGSAQFSGATYPSWLSQTVSLPFNQPYELTWVITTRRAADSNFVGRLMNGSTLVKTFTMITGMSFYNVFHTYSGVTYIPASATTINRIDFRFTSDPLAPPLDMYINYLSLKAADISPYPYTQHKIFQFAYDEQPNRVGIAWMNKLGTYDTHDFIGNDQYSIERESKEYTLPRTFDSNGATSFGFKYNANYDTQVTKKINVNSGWINQQQFEWLIELLASNNVYIYSLPYDNYVQITGYKYNRGTKDTLYSLDLELTYTIADNNVTI